MNVFKQDGALRRVPSCRFALASHGCLSKEVSSWHIPYEEQFTELFQGFALLGNVSGRSPKTLIERFRHEIMRQWPLGDDARESLERKGKSAHYRTGGTHLRGVKNKTPQRIQK